MLAAIGIAIITFLPLYLPLAIVRLEREGKILSDEASKIYMSKLSKDITEGTLKDCEKTLNELGDKINFFKTKQRNVKYSLVVGISSILAFLLCGIEALVSTWSDYAIDSNGNILYNFIELPILLRIMFVVLFSVGMGGLLFIITATQIIIQETLKPVKIEETEQKD